MLIGEERMQCEICVDVMRLEYVVEFKYYGCVLDESGTNETECQRKVTNGRRVAVAIRSLL